MFDVDWNDTFILIMKIAVIAVFAARFIALRKGLTLQKVFFIILFTTPCVICYLYLGKYYALAEFGWLIAGAFDIDFKRIARLYFALSCSIMIVTIVCAQMGIIENLVFYSGDFARYSFGFIYPTDFTAHIFFTCMVWVYIRQSRLSWPEIGIIGALGVFSFAMCHARTNSICLILSAVILLIAKLLHKDGGFGQKLSKVLSISAVAVNGFCAVFMILLTYYYNASNTFMSTMNTVLSNRLELGRIGFDKYNVTLFGQYVKMHGLGGNETAPSNYFYLDSSYVNTLLRYGLVVTAAALLCFLIIGIRAAKTRDSYLLIILVLISVQCMIEHHMLALAYDPFIFLITASSMPARRISSAQSKKHRSSRKR